MDDLFWGISLSERRLAYIVLHPNPNLRSGTAFGARSVSLPILVFSWKKVSNGYLSNTFQGGWLYFNNMVET